MSTLAQYIPLDGVKFSGAIASALVMPGKRDRDTIVTQYRSTAGDGGGGAYVYHATGFVADAVAEDGGFWIKGASADDYLEALDKTVANVKQFGAVGDNATDDTAAIQAALDVALVVYIPEGIYLITGQGLDLKSNQKVYGDGFLSILRQSSSQYVLSAHKGSGGSSTPDIANNIKNVRIRDLAFDNLTGTFSEHVHLLNINAVSDVVVERCLFQGFRGDGIYIGSTNFNNVERHNTDVTVRDCRFDGVNSENRNGISIIDGDRISIYGNEFVNVAKSGMPGCIDVEPNGQTWVVTSNITIRDNRMIGGLGAGVAILLQANDVIRPPNNFLIENNYITCRVGFSFVAYSPPSDESPSLNALFLHNTVDGADTLFTFSGVRGVTLQNNVFKNCNNYGELGLTWLTYDVSLIDNTFHLNGLEGVDALWVRNADSLRLIRNKFIDNGNSAGGSGRAIHFIAGGFTGDRIFLEDNEFSSPTGRTTYAIRVDPSYILNNGNSTDRNNKYLFTTNVDYVANGSNRFTAAPTTGNWTIGNFVYSRSPSSSTLGWLCTATGSPGTWVAVGAPIPRTLITNYSTVQNFNCALYDTFSITVQTDLAITYSAPTGGTIGQVLTIRVKNFSGLVMGTITWNAVFKMNAFVNPANGTSRWISFMFDGTNWIEQNRSATDIPN